MSRPNSSLSFEDEFLLLAGAALTCRFRVYGHIIIDDPYGPKSKWEYYLIGMLDYQAEMRLFVEEKKNATKRVR